MRPARDLTAAGLWGFTEATLFFLVPDVLLSGIALERPRRALGACLIATATALLGGALMYAWGATDVAGAERAVIALPGIGHELVERVHAQLADRGLTALVVGATTGVPYKLYAVAWGAAGGSFALFLAASAVARCARFAAVTALAAGLRRSVLARASERACRVVHLGAWSAFYAWYFWVMGA